jgi:hypothetical protein
MSYNSASHQENIVELSLSPPFSSGSMNLPIIGAGSKISFHI